MSIKGFQVGNGTVQKYDFESLDNVPEIAEVDDTLTTTGAAADAKKTGDEIADLKSAISGIQVVDGKLYIDGVGYDIGGVGITSIAKTGTDGLVDTYTITMTDGTTSTFTVTNGDASDAKIQGFINDWLDEHPEATTTVQDGAITFSKLSNDVKSKIGGGGSGVMSFSRLPYQIFTGFNYQAWCQHNIAEYNGEYVALMYCRNSHTGNKYATKAVFFKGYEIDHIETCTFDGTSSTDVTGAIKSVYEYNGAYYAYLNKTLYTSSDLIAWTTVSGAALLTKYIWGAYNINGNIYMSFDDGYNLVGVSSDNGVTVDYVNLSFDAASENRNEASFVGVDGDIFAFFGKQWTTGTTTGETGYASMAYTENGVWQIGVITNILCNLGDTDCYYDGQYIHVLAKSRLYHNDGGDASVLRHYRAKVADAKQGTFEYVERVDNYYEEIPRHALDSTAVSLFMKKDGTGLLISPVSVRSGVMVYQFYAVNAGDVGNLISEKHEREILEWESRIASNAIYELDTIRPITYYDVNIGTANINTYGNFDVDLNSTPEYIADNESNLLRIIRGGTRYVATNNCEEIFIKYKCPYAPTVSDTKTYIGIILNNSGNAIVLTLAPNTRKFANIGDQTSGANYMAFAMSDPKEVFLVYKDSRYFAYYKSARNGLIKIIFDPNMVLSDSAKLTYSGYWKSCQAYYDENSEVHNLPHFGGQTYLVFSEIKICAKYTQFFATYANTTTSGTAYTFEKCLKENSNGNYKANNTTFVIDVGAFSSLSCSSWGDFTTSTWRDLLLFDGNGKFIRTLRIINNGNAYSVSDAKYATIVVDKAYGNISTMATLTPTT